MTALSIEDLKAWLELLPKLPAGPWGWRGKSSSLHTVGGLWPYGETVLAPTWDYDEGAGIEKAEGVSEHLEKCDPATIAALIEGYIAMAEALSTFMDEHDNTYDGDPLSEGMSVFISKARSALNIGGTND